MARHWLDSRVTRILEDTSAKGIYMHNRTKRTGNWKAEPKPESEWGIVPVEPIVSEKMWDEVNRIVEEQRKATVRPGKRPKHIFAGQTALQMRARHVCAFRNARNTSVKRAGRASRSSILEADFPRPAERPLHRPGAHRRLHSESERSRCRKGAPARIEQRPRSRNSKAQTARAYQLYLDGAIDSPRFKELTGPQEERIRQLQEDALSIQSELDLAGSTASQPKPSSVKRNSCRTGGRPRTEEKRRVVESIVDTIVVDGEAQEIEIHLLRYQHFRRNYKFPADGVTPGAVRCSAWLGVAVIWELVGLGCSGGARPTKAGPLGLEVILPQVGTRLKLDCEQLLVGKPTSMRRIVTEYPMAGDLEDDNGAGGVPRKSLAKRNVPARCKVRRGIDTLTIDSNDIVAVDAVDAHELGSVLPVMGLELLEFGGPGEVEQRVECADTNGEGERNNADGLKSFVHRMRERRLTY